MDEDVLGRIATQLKDEFDQDNASRRPWLEQNATWTQVAMQVMDHKNYPWPGASNVKYPLLTTAALQFHARASQALVRGPLYVRAKVHGPDPSGAKAERAGRVSDFMSYQLRNRIPMWEEDMDRLLFILPIVGMAYKKTYWSKALGRPDTRLVMPTDLCINYAAEEWERARKTHILYMDKNEVIERSRSGEFRAEFEDLTTLDADYSQSVERDTRRAKDDVEQRVPVIPPEDGLYTILECHCWLDLDEDGYEEPYIVTFDYHYGQVARIVPRFTEDDIHWAPEDPNKIARIQAIEYFQCYKFLPAPDSPTFGIGFGTLLGPLNEAVNTLLNQLIDTGTLNNMPSGFLGRGVRLSKGGRVRFRPGEWIVAGSTGEDLRRGVFPLPLKEPSAVLFNLLGLLIQSGEKVGSVAEVLLGESPGQNQPFATTQAVMEQGLMVFQGIYRRVYRQLAKEYQLLFELNRFNLSSFEYTEYLDDVADPRMDFTKEGVDITPEADADVVADLRKMLQVEAVVRAKQAGVQVNDAVLTRWYLDAMALEDREELQNLPEPQPTFDQQIAMQQQQFEQQKWQAEFAWQQEKDRNEAIKDLAQAMAHMAKAEETMQAPQVEQLKAVLDVLSKDLDRDAATQQNRETNASRERQSAVSRQPGTAGGGGA